MADGFLGARTKRGSVRFPKRLGRPCGVSVQLLVQRIVGVVVSLAEFTFDEFFREAVDHYWLTRGAKPGAKPEAFLGRRAEVVGGKQFGGFMVAIEDLLTSLGVPVDWIVHDGKQATVPGWFRASKNWDLLVIEPQLFDQPARLHAVLELKALGGPSYGNNANNGSAARSGDRLVG